MTVEVLPLLRFTGWTKKTMLYTRIDPSDWVSGEKLRVEVPGRCEGEPYEPIAAEALKPSFLNPEAVPNRLERAGVRRPSSGAQ